MISSLIQTFNILYIIRNLLKHIVLKHFQENFERSNHKNCHPAIVFIKIISSKIRDNFNILYSGKKTYKLDFELYRKKYNFQIRSLIFLTLMIVVFGIKQINPENLIG